MPTSGSIEITPGLLIADGAIATNAKLRQIASPTARVGAGAITGRELDADAVRSLVPSVNRNAIINGNFDVWQRGGWINSLGLPEELGTFNTNAFGADRWALGTPTDTLHRLITRQSFSLSQTDVPNSPTYFFRWNQIVAETAPALSQPIEDVRTLAGKVVTVTWWMKGNLNTNITCRLKQSFGGVTPTQVITTATSGGTAALVNGANWTKYEAHFTIPALAGHTIGGDDSALVLQFLLPSSVLFQIDFAQVQLEESAAATAFETHSVLYEIERCQRYLEIHAGVMASNTVTHKPCFYFATRKYRPPDLVLLTGYTGTGATFSTLLNVGYYQDVANSAVSAFFMRCDAEIYL